MRPSVTVREIDTTPIIVDYDVASMYPEMVSFASTEGLRITSTPTVPDYLFEMFAENKDIWLKRVQPEDIDHFEEEKDLFEI